MSPEATTLAVRARRRGDVTNSAKAVALRLAVSATALPKEGTTSEEKGVGRAKPHLASTPMPTNAMTPRSLSLSLEKPARPHLLRRGGHSHVVHARWDIPCSTDLQ